MTFKDQPDIDDTRHAEWNRKYETMEKADRPPRLAHTRTGLGSWRKGQRADRTSGDAVGWCGSCSGKVPDSPRGRRQVLGILE